MVISSMARDMAYPITYDILIREISSSSRVHALLQSLNDAIIYRDGAPYYLLLVAY